MSDQQILKLNFKTIIDPIVLPPAGEAFVYLRHVTTGPGHDQLVIQFHNGTIRLIAQD